MILNRINYKKIILTFVMIIIICLLKYNYINDTSYQDSAELMRNFLIFWGNNYLINLIWILPILMNLVFVSKKYYFKLINFDTRYKNRNKYILNFIKNCLIYSFFYNLVLILIQIFIIGFLSNSDISFSIETIKLIISYILENTFLNFLLIFLALNIRNYMYSLLLIIILCVILLTTFSNNIYIPFVSLYWTNNINFITIALLILVLFFIRKKYLKFDIGGYENDFRN